MLIGFLFRARDRVLFIGNKLILGVVEGPINGWPALGFATYLLGGVPAGLDECISSLIDIHLPCA